MSVFKPASVSHGCQFYQPDFAVGFQRCELEAGQGFRVTEVQQSQFLFVRSGMVEVDCNEHRGVCACAGQMLFLPCSSECRVTAPRQADLLMLGFDDHLQICVKLMLEQMEPLLEEVTFEFRPLHVCRPMERAIESALLYIGDGVDCAHLYQIKQLEITYIFRHYYSTQDKLMFFYPIIGKSVDFRTLVLSKYGDVRTAEELAEACGYGIKNFHRLFLEQFGMPPYRWMQHQWAKHIYGKLLDDRIPIKAIVAEYHFTSQSHLTLFCKRYLGGTPLQIRQRELKKIKANVEP